MDGKSPCWDVDNLKVVVIHGDLCLGHLVGVGDVNGGRLGEVLNVEVTVIEDPEALHPGRAGQTRCCANTTSRTQTKLQVRLESCY